MLPSIYHSMTGFINAKRGVRWLLGQPRLDVVFITPLPETEIHSRYFRFQSNKMHSKGPCLQLDGICGETRTLHFTAQEMYAPATRRQAKLALIEAITWAEEQGAKVVLLASATKHLFGRNAAELKARFPNLVFTTGQNGTARLLCSDIEHILAQSGWDHSARILVISPYETVGGAVSEYLVRKGFNTVGYGPHRRLLVEYGARTGLPVMHELNSEEHFDLVVVCSQGRHGTLNQAMVDQLRHPQRQLFVLDLTEMGSIHHMTSSKPLEHVVRQDGGHGFHPSLRYDFGPLDYKKLHLPAASMFGGFAEALALYDDIYRQYDSIALDRDWFEVNPANTARITQAFEDLGITHLQQAHCYGNPISDFGTPRTKEALNTARFMPLNSIDMETQAH